MLVLLESALLYILRFVSSPEGIAIIDAWEAELEARIEASTNPQPSNVPTTVAKSRNSSEGILP